MTKYKCENCGFTMETQENVNITECPACKSNMFGLIQEKNNYNNTNYNVSVNKKSNFKLILFILIPIIILSTILYFGFNKEDSNIAKQSNNLDVFMSDMKGNITFVNKDGKIEGFIEETTNIEGWDDVVKTVGYDLSTYGPTYDINGVPGYYYILGLTKQGTLKIYLNDRYFSVRPLNKEQEEQKQKIIKIISSKKNIKDIAIGVRVIYLLNNDGTVDVIELFDKSYMEKYLNIKYEEYSENYPTEKIRKLKNIKNIYVRGFNEFIALTESGKVIGYDLCSYDDKNNIYIEYDWENIEKIICSYNHVIGITKEGKIVINHEDYEMLNDITNVKDVGMALPLPTFGCYVVILKNDGTVEVELGEYENQEKGDSLNYDYLKEAETWTGIEKIYVSNGFIAGFRKDGTIVTVGSPKNDVDIENMKVK